MKRITVLFGLATAVLVASLVLHAQAQAKAPTVAVFKDPTCGCCAKWADHLKQNGFETTITETATIDKVKDEHHVPAQARSCHTAIVDGYVIEGHVPAADIQRLLREHPKNVVGLAVPGMPIGSPGMEVAGMKAQPFDVVAFDKDGKTTVFASHKQ